jgi:hypothetical protein
MKPFLILVAAVALLLAVWFLVAPPWKAGPAGPENTSELQLPPVSDKAALVRAAQQLLKCEANSRTVHDGVALLEALARGVSDDDWSAVQEPAFRGWTAFSVLPGSREGLEPVAETLLARFALHGSAMQIESLIRASNQNSVWKPQIDRALDGVVGREVSEGKYVGSRLAVLLEAALAAEDFDRASAFTAKARWAAEVTDATRAPFVQLVQALRAYFALKQGGADLDAVLAEIVRAPKGSGSGQLAGPLLLSLGGMLAREGKDTRDFSRLRHAMEATRAVEGAAQYWSAALDHFGDSLPDFGRYAETDTLEGLVRNYVEVYGGDSEFESAFWTRLIERNQINTTAEAMWRVACLGRAIKSSSDESAKIVWLRKLVSEYLNFQEPGRGLKKVQDLSPSFAGEEGRKEIEFLLADLGKKEQSHQATLRKMDGQSKEMAVQAEIALLRRSLAGARESQASPEKIKTLEQRLKELEKKLPE